MGLMLSYESNKKSSMETKLQDLTAALEHIFSDDGLDNGLYLNNIYIPEEILIHILSFVPIENLLKLRLVCKKWYNLTKTPSLWSTLFRRINRKPPRGLPWYVCYKYLDNSILDVNLLKNNCGQEKLNHWILVEQRYNRIQIEKTPIGSDPTPAHLPDFNGAKSCFVTSYDEATKTQKIPLNSPMAKLIIKKFKPPICISEWYAGRFDCGGSYHLIAELYRNTKQPEGQMHKEIVCQQTIDVNFNANEATKWQKVQIVLDDYPDDIDGILFTHKAKDNQFWAGNYGPKMAGGVVKLSFDGIEPSVNSETKNSSGQLDLTC